MCIRNTISTFPVTANTTHYTVFTFGKYAVVPADNVEQARERGQQILNEMYPGDRNKIRCVRVSADDEFDIWNPKPIDTVDADEAKNQADKAFPLAIEADVPTVFADEQDAE